MQYACIIIQIKKRTHMSSEMNKHTFSKDFLVVGIRMNARVTRMALEFHLTLEIL